MKTLSILLTILFTLTSCSHTPKKQENGYLEIIELVKSQKLDEFNGSLIMLYEDGRFECEFNLWLNDDPKSATLKELSTFFNKHNYLFNEDLAKVSKSEKIDFTDGEGGNDLSFMRLSNFLSMRIKYFFIKGEYQSAVQDIKAQKQLWRILNSSEAHNFVNCMLVNSELEKLCENINLFMSLSRCPDDKIIEVLNDLPSENSIIHRHKLGLKSEISTFIKFFGEDDVFKVTQDVVSELEEVNKKLEIIQQNTANSGEQAAEIFVTSMVDSLSKRIPKLKLGEEIELKPIRAVIKEWIEEGIARTGKPYNPIMWSLDESSVKLNSRQRELCKLIPFDLNFQEEIETLVSLRATHLVCACNLYQNKYKKYPEKLDDLVPQFIKSVPVDPYDGKPMRYNRERGIIYSVGEGQVDSGGFNGADHGRLQCAKLRPDGYKREHADIVFYLDAKIKPVWGKPSKI